MAFALQTVIVRNKLESPLTNVKVLYAQSNKKTGWWDYATDWRVVDVEDETNVLVQDRTSVVVGSVPVEEETRVSTSILFAEGARGYWQVYFDYNGRQYKIDKNNAQVNPWPVDDKKYVEITVRFEETTNRTRIRIDFVMSSGNAYFYAKQYGCPCI
jgi:hypothetical protein